MRSRSRKAAWTAPPRGRPGRIENTREIELVIRGGKIYEPRELIAHSPR